MADDRVYQTPAYSMYPDAFDQGTDHMALDEVGAYIRLLNSQWAKGSIPGDNLQSLSRIMRCQIGAGRRIWTTLQAKFERGPDGLWRNARLEKEREKQKARRAKLAENGSKGGRPRNQKDNQKDNQNESNRFPVAIANDNQNKSLPSPSPDPPSVPLKLGTTTTMPSVDLIVASSSPLLMSSLRFAKLRQSHAFVGSRLRVPNVLHDELRTKLGGDSPNTRLLDWYYDLNAEVEQSGEPILDVFQWLRPKFLEWAGDMVADAELALHRPKGA